MVSVVVSRLVVVVSCHLVVCGDEPQSGVGIQRRRVSPYGPTAPGGVLTEQGASRCRRSIACPCGRSAPQ